MKRRQPKYRPTPPEVQARIAEQSASERMDALLAYLKALSDADAATALVFLLKRLDLPTE